MHFVNKHLRELAPYKVASHRIWEVSPIERKDILKLDWNEATIPPSPKVKEAILSFIEDESVFSLYPSTYNDTLMQALSDYSEQPIENIQYFASSDALHEYIVRMYIEKGDKILLITPTYDNFRLTCESQGGQIVSFEYKQDFSLNIALLKETIREKTPALIYICNPNNPTGNIISNDIILDIINEFRATLFLIDEAYYEFSGQTMSPYVKNYDNLFISRTFSKAFGLANFRIGYLLSQKANIDQISIIRNAKNVTSFAQIAAIVALSDLDYMRKYVSEVNYAKTQFKNEISRLNGIINVFESSGNFLLLEFDSKESKETIYNILYNNGIYVRNLTHSDLLIKCLRITIGTISQMEKVKTLMAKFCGYK